MSPGHAEKFSAKHRISVFHKNWWSKKLNKDNVKTVLKSNLPLAHYPSVLSQMMVVSSENFKCKL